MLTIKNYLKRLETVGDGDGGLAGTGTVEDGDGDGKGGDGQESEFLLHSCEVIKNLSS
jgi:hypothetical protein